MIKLTMLEMIWLETHGGRGLKDVKIDKYKRKYVLMQNRGQRERVFIGWHYRDPELKWKHLDELA